MRLRVRTTWCHRTRGDNAVIRFMNVQDCDLFRAEILFPEGSLTSSTSMRVGRRRQLLHEFILTLTLGLLPACPSLGRDLFRSHLWTLTLSCTIQSSV